MTQRVQCPTCQLQIKVKERLYGRKVACKCGTVMRMPSAPESSPDPEPEMLEPFPEASALPPPPAPTPTSPIRQSLPSIRFQCPRCSQTLEVDGNFAGEVSECPCGTRIRVPEASAPVEPEPFEAMPMAAEPDPFGQSFEPEYQLAADDPLMSASSFEGTSTGGPAYLQPGKRQPVTTSKKKRKRKKRKTEEESSASGEVLAGIGMMVGAVVWFVLGFMAGYIFFYPPILFFIGLASVCKGLFKL